MTKIHLVANTFQILHSMNVKTNVAKKYLTLLDKCFPKSHKFHKLFNRNNVKVSYSCLPNISNIIALHNRKVLSNTNNNQDPKCNCREKDNCPLNGKCLDSHLIYLYNVKITASEEGTHYIELTENTFKERWNQHKNSFKHEGKANSTELSKYVWELKKKGTTPIISWKVIGHAHPYNNGLTFCHLCATEKFRTITSKCKTKELN